MLINFVDATNDANHYTKPPPNVMCKAADSTQRALLLRPRRGAEYRNQFACLSVCVCPRAYLWNRWTDLHDVFCADPLWPWLGPLRAALRYVVYFRFYRRCHIWP